MFAVDTALLYKITVSSSEHHNDCALTAQHSTVSSSRHRTENARRQLSSCLIYS